MPKKNRRKKEREVKKREKNSSKLYGSPRTLPDCPPKFPNNEKSREKINRAGAERKEIIRIRKPHAGPANEERHFDSKRHLHEVGCDGDLRSPGRGLIGAVKPTGLEGIKGLKQIGA
jgi:hypothetical protein